MRQHAATVPARRTKPGLVEWYKRCVGATSTAVPRHPKPQRSMHPAVSKQIPQAAAVAINACMNLHGESVI